ncbi:hypothetical protein ES705_44066 [subsurface metagenome]
MAWLVFLYALTLGAEQSNVIVDYDLEWYGYIETQASVLLWDTLEIGGSALTRIIPKTIIRYSPVETDFLFFAQIQYQMLSVGIEHLCSHNFKVYSTRGMHGYNRIYLRISNKG